MNHTNKQTPSESCKKILSKEMKLDDDPELARMIFGIFTINGVNYCRPHLMISCHLCEEDSFHIQEECDEERKRLNLRPGGDPQLNKRAEFWRDRILSELFKVKATISKKKAFPPGMKTKEKAINDDFLEDVSRAFKEGASQCCYWGCEKPDAEKLLKCAGCGVVKYCCKEHQKLDWKWEHKYECTKSVPKNLLDEMEADRKRNLRGNYNNKFGLGV